MGIHGYGPVCDRMVQTCAERKQAWRDLAMCRSEGLECPSVAQRLEMLDREEAVCYLCQTSLSHGAKGFCTRNAPSMG